MKSFLSLLIAFVAINTELFAAEAGMPQLDPTFWASQAFWLILVFTILYIAISKFYLPKIKDNLDNRENKINEDLDNANKFKEESEKKLKEYDLIMNNAKKEISKIHFDSKNILNKRFDIIFMDPPYKESKINRLIENIIEKKILNKKGIIIIHRHKKDKLKITEKIKILDIRNYGISKVYFGN